MKLSFFRTPAAVLLLGCAMLAATASAAEADTGRVLQMDMTPAPQMATMTPTPAMMPSHDSHDDHDDHEHSEHSEAPTPAPLMAESEGDGAAALGGANTLVAAVGCALAAAAGAVAVL